MNDQPIYRPLFIAPDGVPTEKVHLIWKAISSRRITYLRVFKQKDSLGYDMSISVLSHMHAQNEMQLASLLTLD